MQLEMQLLYLPHVLSIINHAPAFNVYDQIISDMIFQILMTYCQF